MLTGNSQQIMQGRLIQFRPDAKQFISTQYSETARFPKGFELFLSPISSAG